MIRYIPATQEDILTLSSAERGNCEEMDYEDMKILW